MTLKPKIFITGASCSGVTTLGAELASRFSVPQIDIDDFYWMPTDPPYRVKRPPEDRVRMIADRQQETEGWVLTGSFMGWGEALIPDVNLIIFIYTSASVRLRRLEQREAARYGSRILPGGDNHEAYLAFREWALQYDNPHFSGRNSAQHERWLSKQHAPVLRLEGDGSVRALADTVEAQWFADS